MDLGSSNYLGRSPIQHGVLGWNVYRPDVDVVVKPLPFVTAGDADPADVGLSPADLREGRSCGRRLAAAGVDVRRVVPAGLVDDETGLDDEGKQTYYGYVTEDCTEAIDEGLWGPGEPSGTFRRHCGDLLVIPDELGVWHAGEADELDLVGMHGGCHPDEMIVPFAVARADRLQ